MREAKITKLTPSGSALLISDADPDDAALLHNAVKVLDFARRTLADPKLTADELRFVCRQLADCLHDMIGFADDAGS